LKHITSYSVLLTVIFTFSRHHADLLHKKDASEANERSYQQQQQRKLLACKRGSSKLNESLEQLKSTAGSTMDMYREVDSELDCYEGTKPATEQCSFLSSYSLNSYHSLEEKFTQALVAYTKKQFFQVNHFLLVCLICCSPHLPVRSYTHRLSLMPSLL